MMMGQEHFIRKNDQFEIKNDRLADNRAEASRKKLVLVF